MTEAEMRPKRLLPSMPRTTLVGQPPWPGSTPTPRPSYGPRVDIEKLKIGNAPLPVQRRISNKYHIVFAKLKPGQCIECHPEHVNPVAAALRNWIKKTGKAGRVMSERVGEDGIGRAWWVTDSPTEAATAKAKKP